MKPRAVAGQSWGYTYDAIGNRSSMTRSAAAVRQADATLGPATSFTTSYTPNAVNQYAQIDPPQAIEVAGLTVPEVTQVSVNGAPTTGRPPGNGEPGGFSLWLEGAALGTWPQVSIQATRTGARANGSDLTTVRSGHVYVRPQEIPTYDPDGNLLSDAGWQYEWDADNRLILAQQKEPGLPADMPQKRIKYHYDWMSRLVAREESERRTLNNGTGLRSDTWTLVKTTHHYYDGWNLMAEVESGETVSVAGSPSPKVRRCLHGLDLSNTHEVGLANGPRTSTTATGGVGTLLGVIAPDDRLYTACTEVNGNLTGFIEASAGALAARFDYDAFGNVVTDWSAPGHNAAEISQIRFSTKFQDPETGWLFYGYRWYDPVNGRWTAKDPIAEAGGLNLYGMVGNDAVNSVDVLGHIILCNCQLDRAFKEFGVSNWNEEGSSDTVHRYTRTVENISHTPDKKSLQKLIVIRMMNSNIAFEIDPSDCYENFKKHVHRRIEIIENTKNAKFGWPKPTDSESLPPRDPGIAPQKYYDLANDPSTKVGCMEGSSICTGGPGLPYSAIMPYPAVPAGEGAGRPVPGDTGYFRNTGTVRGRADDGENVIHVGLRNKEEMFWGHLPGGGLSLSYQEWSGTLRQLFQIERVSWESGSYPKAGLRVN